MSPTRLECVLARVFDVRYNVRSRIAETLAARVGSNLISGAGTTSPIASVRGIIRSENVYVCVCYVRVYVYVAAGAVCMRMRELFTFTMVGFYAGDIFIALDAQIITLLFAGYGRILESAWCVECLTIAQCHSLDCIIKSPPTLYDNERRIANSGRGCASN